MISKAWPAPAKLNLFLHVTGRRDDGYHLLQTVFQFLDLCDLMDFDVTSEPAIRRKTEVPGVPEEDDLIIRAARLLQRASNGQQGVEISIDKRIPMQGGLGGGSSDAATTLVALNHLWGLGHSVDSLMELGVTLGADVPVFIQGQAAFAEGVGERLKPVEPNQDIYLVLRPDCEISTGDIFQAEDLTRTTPPITIRDFLRDGGHNDCLPVVEKRYPEVTEAMSWLGQYSVPRLTGTGSCIFAVFESADKAKQALADMPERWQGFVCHGVNRSPLLSRLTQND